MKNSTVLILYSSLTFQSLKKSHKLLEKTLSLHIQLQRNTYFYCEAAFVNFSYTLFYEIRHLVVLCWVARNYSKWLDTLAGRTTLAGTAKYLQAFLMSSNSTLSAHKICHDIKPIIMYSNTNINLQFKYEISKLYMRHETTSNIPNKCVVTTHIYQHWAHSV